MRLLLLFSLLSFTASCGANHYSVFRKYDSNAGENIIIDASQRAILTNKIEYNKFTTVGTGDNERQVRDSSKTISRYCAEPSPDVFTVLSSSFAASGAVTNEGERQQAALNLAQSISQAGSTISRTQTIQTLRDVLFNECLQWMNDAVSRESYETRAARNHRMLVSILAIEQLTNATRPQGSAITASGSASVTSNIEVIVRKLDESRTKLEAAEKTAKEKSDAVIAKTAEAEEAARALKLADEERTALGAPDLDPKPTPEKIAAADLKVKNATEGKTKADKAVETAKAEQKKADGTVSDLKKAIQALEDALQKPDSLMAQGIAEAQFSENACCTPDKAVSTEVANAIKQIVQANIEFDDFALFCTGVLGKAPDPSDTSVREFCIKHFETKKEVAIAQAEEAKAQAALFSLRATEANKARLLEEKLIDDLFGEIPED